MSNNRNKKIFNLTLVGLMTAIATVIYMVFPEINIVPGVSHLKVDFSDFPAILTGVIIGPVQGILVEVFKNIIHLTRTTTVGIGEIMNIILGSSMILSMWGFVKLFKKISTNFALPIISLTKKDLPRFIPRKVLKIL